MASSSVLLDQLVLISDIRHALGLSGVAALLIGGLGVAVAVASVWFTQPQWGG